MAKRSTQSGSTRQAKPTTQPTGASNGAENKQSTTVPIGSENQPEETKNLGSRVSITAPHRRRRAGINFGPSPTIVAVDDLSEADRSAIVNDKVLNVAPVIDDE